MAFYKVGYLLFAAIILSASVEAFVPTGLPACVRASASPYGTAATTTPLGVGQSMLRTSKSNAASSLSMSAESDSELSRRNMLVLAPALAALYALPSEAEALTTPAKMGKEGTAVEVPGFLQHAVIVARDLDEEVEFWTQGMGMKVLRSRTVDGDVTKFVGYGPESLTSTVGGHFSLEIHEGGRKMQLGTGLQRFNVQLPSSIDRILKIEDAGGSVVPRWFGTADFVEVASPSGYVARIQQAKQATDYPMSSVTLRTNSMAKTVAFMQAVGLTKQPGGMLPFLGDGSETFRFQASGGGEAIGTSIVLEPVPKDTPAVTAGDTFNLAVLCDDMSKAKDAAVGVGAEVLLDGAFPGVGTKVVALKEPGTGYTIILVDPAGFQKEMPKAPAPKPKAAPAPKPEAAAPVAKGKE